MRPKSSEDFPAYFKFHPKQTSNNSVVKKVFYCKDGTSRKWLTYNAETHRLHCYICMAFAKSSDSNIFISGMNDWNHVHQRIEEHEKTNLHKSSAEAYFFRATETDIKHLLGSKQISIHREQVRKRRLVLERVTDVVKVIGKRGLSFRGTKFEASYTLDDPSIDHGNFLEMITLLGKYDIVMKEHLSECVEKSKKHHQTKSKAQGRGSFVSFLSKNTVNEIINNIQQAIQQCIANEVNEAGMFSVEIDTTQDITSQDQCAVVLRYVTDVIHERLVAVVNCEASTGEYFVKMLKDVLCKLKLDISNCIGNATDGASNMQGQFRGFSALLSEHSPKQVHVWCYAHVLNLILVDTTGLVVASASLFTLLNDIAVFIRESYKRMNVWLKESQSVLHQRLAIIGETRWWAKDDSLRKVFGSFGNPDRALYIDVLQTLAIILEVGVTVKPVVRAKARGYIESLLKYETILTSQIFLRIFEHTTPLSKYLQTSRMDILSAYRMVTTTQENVEGIKRDFEGVKVAADTFVQWANEKLQLLQDENQLETELEVQSQLPQKRVRKKKIMPGEVAPDETLTDADRAYEVEVHNQILDQVSQSLHDRFLSHGTLYSDLAFLDPKNFDQMSKITIMQYKSLFAELSKCLLKFDSRATVENLQSELKSLASQWAKLKQVPLEDYKVKGVSEKQDSSCSDDEDEIISNSNCSFCKNCPICCYQILSRYNLLTDAYHVIGLAYKFLLTLPVTQVTCERSFSTLKFIKDRLRSTLSQEHLQAFMLMAVEKGMLMTLDNDAIIDKVAEKSSRLRKLLTY